MGSATTVQLSEDAASKALCREGEFVFGETKLAEVMKAVFGITVRKPRESKSI